MENTHNHYPHNHYSHNDNDHCHHTHNPCQGFHPSQSQLCFFEHIVAPNIQEMIDASLPDMSVLNALVDGIDDYECNTGILYQCNDVILFKGGFYESRKNNNDRHPHDDNSWKEHGKLKDIFSKLSVFENVSNISIEYHNSCDMSAVCKPFYMIGNIVALSVDTGNLDSCGNAIFEDVYYVSTADNNMETPSPEAENWNGPMTVDQLLAGGALSGQVVCDAINTLPNQCEEV